MKRSILRLLVFTLILVGVPAIGSVYAAPIHRADRPVAGSYIVFLKPEVIGKGDNTFAPHPTLSVHAQDLALRFGGIVRRTYEGLLPAFAIDISEQRASALSNDSRVDHVDEDFQVDLTTDQLATTLWHLDRIDERTQPLDNHYTYNRTGSGVNIYVVDTGVQDSASEFGSRLHHAWTFNPSLTTICNPHGTNVASLAGGVTYGSAKAPSIFDVRIGDVCSCSSAPGENAPLTLGTNSCALIASNLLAGLTWVSNNNVKPAIVNLSSSVPNCPIGGSGCSSLDAAVNSLTQAGIVVVVSAGNDGGDACNSSPGHLSSVITVGGTDNTDARAIYTSPNASDYGSCVSVFAPGKNTPALTGNFGGTSAASPITAGVAALYLSGTPTATPSQVRSFLTGNATAGVLTGIGTGSPNLLLYQPYPGGAEVDNYPVAHGTVTCHTTTNVCTFDASSSTDDFKVQTCQWLVDVKSGPGGSENDIYRTSCFPFSYQYSYPVTNGIEDGLTVWDDAGHHTIYSPPGVTYVP